MTSLIKAILEIIFDAFRTWKKKPTKAEEVVANRDDADRFKRWVDERLR
jgi:hypothetical protein